MLAARWWSHIFRASHASFRIVLHLYVHLLFSCLTRVPSRWLFHSASDTHTHTHTADFCAPLHSYIRIDVHHIDQSVLQMCDIGFGRFLPTPDNSTMSRGVEPIKVYRNEPIKVYRIVKQTLWMHSSVYSHNTWPFERNQGIHIQFV